MEGKWPHAYISREQKVRRLCYLDMAGEQTAWRGNKFAEFSAESNLSVAQTRDMRKSWPKYEKGRAVDDGLEVDEAIYKQTI